MSKKNIVLAVIAAIVLIQALVYLRILPGRKPPAPANVNITFWGFQDDGEVWRDIILTFQKKYSHINVSYQRLDRASYEETLVNRMAEGKGPDVLMLPNTLLFKHRDKIYPLPQQTLAFSARHFSPLFVDAAYEELVSPEGIIFGLPLFIDTPVLFYNKDIFNAAGIATTPNNWDEVTAISRKLTEKNNVGEIIKSGLPLGTSQNVEHSFEIVSSLIFQEGDPIIRRSPSLALVLEESATKAFAFYTSFADPSNANFSWSNRLAHSLTAFSQTTSAFGFGFYEDIARVRAKNPHLNFGILSFPQKKDIRFPVVYARYSFPTVSKSSPNILAAWQFVDFITRGEGAKMYIDKTGLPPARRDLLANRPTNPDLDVFYRQALIAKTWPIPDESRTKRLFSETIESIVSHTNTAHQAVQNLKGRLDLLLP
ncbi:MAG: extracellular solute-binding protein [Candidatus Sungbacteria bacterium]|nr:extracellular solute-binding protein [bacterium]MDZ4286137.1 extracellular solute-binding protein [Candidatus Sungbacteria bacterium]